MVVSVGVPMKKTVCGGPSGLQLLQIPISLLLVQEMRTHLGWEWPTGDVWLVVCGALLMLHNVHLWLSLPSGIGWALSYKFNTVLLRVSLELMEFIHAYLQTETFVESLANASLTDGEKRAFLNISQDLNVALQSATEKKVPIPPQDLKTVAAFVKVVAE